MGSTGQEIKMKEQERAFISYVDDSHPALQELPEDFRKLWFKGYQNPVNHNIILFLQMERIFKNENAFIDVLTMEIADEDAVLEWEDEFPDRSFVAVEPYTAFFDGMDGDRAMFSLGSINTQSMLFEPELEIYLTLSEDGILLDFQEGEPEIFEY